MSKKIFSDETVKAVQDSFKGHYKVPSDGKVVVRKAKSNKQTIERVLVIPDLHGKDCWRKAVDTIAYDHVVFLGDYVDSYDLSDEKIVENLKRIIDYKIEHDSRVTLLLGNHDMQYMYYPRFGCSGFRHSIRDELETLFEVYCKFFSLAKMINGVLYTHAGVSEEWVKDCFKDNPVLTVIDLLITKKLNPKFIKRDSFILDKVMKVGRARGGYGKSGGPIWADKEELMRSPIQGLVQLVGHSKVKKLTRVKDAHFLDTLDSNNRVFYVVDTYMNIESVTV